MCKCDGKWHPHVLMTQHFVSLEVVVIVTQL